MQSLFCNSSDNDYPSDNDFSFNAEVSLYKFFLKLQPYSYNHSRVVGDSSDDEGENNNVGNIEWCLCGCCKPMETEAENLCCREAN